MIVAFGNTDLTASRAVLNSWYPPSQLRHCAPKGKGEIDVLIVLSYSIKFWVVVESYISNSEFRLRHDVPFACVSTFTLSIDERLQLWLNPSSDNAAKHDALRHY